MKNSPWAGTSEIWLTVTVIGTGESIGADNVEREKLIGRSDVTSNGTEAIENV